MKSNIELIVGEKGMKRVLFVLFVLMIWVIGAANESTAYAGGEENVTGVCGTDLTWELDLNTGELIISGNGEMGVDEPWEMYADSITSVVINEGITRIADEAFLGYPQLTSISIPSSVVSIGYRPFASCASLTGIWVDKDNAYFSSDANGVLFDKEKNELLKAPGALSGEYSVPNGVSRICEFAFHFCPKLTGLTFPASVIEIEWLAICSSTALKQLTFTGDAPDIDTYGFGGEVFTTVSATAYYSVINETWTSVAGDYYAADLAWVPYYEVAGDTETDLDIDRDERLVLYVSGDFMMIKSITIDGQAVDPTNYVVAGNNIIVTFSPDYVQTLSSGEHTVTVDVMSKEDLIKEFVHRCYVNILERNADPDGLNYWVEQLASERQTAAQVAASFVFSEEFKNQNNSNGEFLDRLYATFFGRVADESGKNFWLNYLENGVTREYVTAQFVNSAEFTEVCAAYGMQRGSIGLTGYVNVNPNLTMYVVRCYREIHGRDADSSGQEYWCRMIFTKERDAKFVAKSFIDSAEFTDRNLSNTEFVEVLYRTFMGRDSDPSGLAYWVGRLEGGTARLQVVDEFANCFEFWEILKSFGLASKVTSISIMTKSSIYDYDYTLVASDLIVTAVCEDGFTMTITDSFEITQGAAQDMPWVYVNYEGVKSNTIAVAHAIPAITSVIISANGAGYPYGYELFSQDLCVNVSYEDGSNRTITDGFEITQTGTSVWVTYKGVKSNTITVTFSEPGVTDVVISAKASEYEAGYQLTTDDLNVTAYPWTYKWSGF